jgi:hypothetical protein
LSQGLKISDSYHHHVALILHHMPSSRIHLINEEITFIGILVTKNLKHMHILIKLYTKTMLITSTPKFLLQVHCSVLASEPSYTLMMNKWTKQHKDVKTNLYDSPQSLISSLQLPSATFTETFSSSFHSTLELTILQFWNIKKRKRKPTVLYKIKYHCRTWQLRH